MTYSAFETSVESGRPVEIYLFEIGGDLYPYTSADVEQVVNSITYEPVPLGRNEIVVGPEDRRNVLEVSMPSSLALPQLYITAVPGKRAKLTVQRFHSNDTPTPELATIFTGFVRSVAFTRNAGEAKVACIPIAAATSRQIPRFTFQGLCNHVLYDPRCTIDENDSSYRHDGTVLSISGNDIVVQGADGFTDGWFTGGFVENAGGLDHRMILGHTGTTLTMMLPFGTDPTGSTVTVRAGCDHTITTCQSKFDNVINYGGFAFIPVRNIFQTGLQ